MERLGQHGLEGRCRRGGENFGNGSSEHDASAWGRARKDDVIEAETATVPAHAAGSYAGKQEWRHDERRIGTHTQAEKVFVRRERFPLFFYKETFVNAQLQGLLSLRSSPGSGRARVLCHTRDEHEIECHEWI